ncbi:MAG: MBL fold metallo-hydrolase [Planctomycetota bacterium]|nr:MBL fold metallo-hydrolase [Planctomycetota bacterium]MDA1138139.1 MBL fold metallo-hydrolase [Planctomycetota bacterium]
MSSSDWKIQGSTGDGPGLHLLPNVYLVAWLGMTKDEIDCSAWVIRTEQGLLMIDCGTPWGHTRLQQNMQHWGLSLDDLSCILLTHGHVDHGRGGYLFRQLGIEMLAHPAAAELAESEWATCLKAEGSSESYQVSGYLNGGETIERCGLKLQVFHTPGHTASCLTFLIEIDGEPCLFSGDLIMGNGLPGYRGDPGYSEQAIVDGMNRLLEEEFTHLLYGHGYRLDDRGKLFREALEKHQRGEWLEGG